MMRQDGENKWLSSVEELKAFKEDNIHYLYYELKCLCRQIKFEELELDPAQSTVNNHSQWWYWRAEKTSGKKERGDRDTSSVRQRENWLLSPAVNSLCFGLPAESSSTAFDFTSSAFCRCQNTRAGHKTFHWTKAGQSERETVTAKTLFDSSPHLKRTNTNTFSIYMACWLPVVSGDAPAELR